MGKTFSGRDFKKMVADPAYGPRKTMRVLTEALEAKKLRPDDFSIRDLFEHTVEHGREALDLMSPRKSGGRNWASIRTYLEAGGHAVNTATFSEITGQLLITRVKEAYDDPAFLHPELCETQQSDLLDTEKIVGIGRLGDNAEQVDEGMPYPLVGLNAEYIERAAMVKRGLIVPVTRECIVADRTGQLLRWAAEAGKWLGLNKEKRVLDVAVGVTNNYKRNGTATNTYLTSGAYVNSHTNALVDWTDFENVELLMEALTDPNTGEPIVGNIEALLVPTALKHTALRLLGAEHVEHVDNQANAATIRTQSPNPFRGAGWKVLSSPYVKLRTSSASTWFAGQFKRAFRYYEAWGIETSQAPAGNEADFNQDIMFRHKASEMGVCQAEEPRAVVKNTG